jgi:hypothetical protein
MMTVRHVRSRPVVGMLILAVALPACRAKEPAPGTQQAPASTVVTTTTSTTTTTMPPPPPVWRGAKWGMKKAEVLAAFPGEAQRLSQPATFGQPRPGAGDVAILAYEADGSKFRVLFGFAADALDRIQLFAAKAGDSTCGDLEKRLTEEHSKPSSRSDNATSMQTREIVWTLPGQTITLACAEKPSLDFRTVTVDYVAAPKESPAN